MLTGSAAVEAISLYTRLGETGARFDGRRVARAVRTSTGRARLRAAVLVAVKPTRSVSGAVQGRRAPRPRLRLARRLRGLQRVSGLSPGRPARPIGGR